MTPSFYCEHKVVSDAIQLYIGDRLTSPGSQHLTLSVRLPRQCCLRSKGPTACSCSFFPGRSPWNCFGNCEGQDLCWLFSGLDQLPGVIHCWWEQHRCAPARPSGHPLSKMAPKGPAPFQAGCGPPAVSPCVSDPRCEASGPRSPSPLFLGALGLATQRCFAGLSWVASERGKSSLPVTVGCFGPSYLLEEADKHRCVDK